MTFWEICALECLRLEARRATLLLDADIAIAVLDVVADRSEATRPWQEPRMAGEIRPARSTSLRSAQPCVCSCTAVSMLHQTTSLKSPHRYDCKISTSHASQCLVV